MNNAPRKTPQKQPGDPEQAGAKGEHWRYCPRCGHELENHKCKLTCPRCHYFMSCSDFD
ncbi:MAG: hypothetical protein HZA91_17975 [Verrucomicrobia bacterium]|nr:hypothetical protein [Verrucomicrobiota bacterium]